MSLVYTSTAQRRDPATSLHYTVHRRVVCSEHVAAISCWRWSWIWIDTNQQLISILYWMLEKNKDCPCEIMHQLKTTVVTVLATEAKAMLLTIMATWLANISMSLKLGPVLAVGHKMCNIILTAPWQVDLEWCISYKKKQILSYFWSVGTKYVIYIL